MKYPKQPKGGLCCCEGVELDQVAQAFKNGAVAECLGVLDELLVVSMFALKVASDDRSDVPHPSANRRVIEDVNYSARRVRYLDPHAVPPLGAGAKELAFVDAL